MRCPKPHLAVQPNHEDHEEEHDGPEVRDGHLSHGLGIHNKDEARALGDHLLHGFAGRVAHEAQHREDDEASEHRGEAVDARDNHSVSATGWVCWDKKDKK